MVIKTLKTVLISITFTIFILNFSSIIDAKDSTNTDKGIKAENIENKQTDTTKMDTPNSPTINALAKLIKNTSENLEKLSSILEFIAQAINKGSIVLKNKKTVKNWIQDNQETIESLEQSLNVFDLDISKIFKINCVSKFHIAHVYDQFDKQFEDIRNFDIDLDDIILKKQGVSKITPKSTQQLISLNLKQILTLQDKANEIGLTAVNKTARKLEQFNDKYQITKTLDIIPPSLLIGFLIFYYLPKEYFQNSYWKYFKIKIGTSEWTKKNKGLIQCLVKICSKDYGTLSMAFAAVAAYVNKESLGKSFPEFGKFLSYLRDCWSELKGLEVKNNSKYQIIENITLDDERIVGLGSQKEELKRALNYIANPEMYYKRQNSPGNAFMIVGPPGNGKTLLAKALAGSANSLLRNKGSNNRVAFKEVKWAEISWTREGLKKIIEQAKPHAPCFLFFDEIHLLNVQAKEGGPTLADLLTELDGANASNSAANQIIFVAATNHPEMMDSALIRSGRFGTIIHVEKPSFDSRKKFFEVMCKHNLIDTTNMDLDLLVRLTSKCSNSDLNAVLNEARFTACNEMRRINQKHIEDRIKKIIFRIEDDLILNDFEKKHLSASKAGSALMYLLLDPREKLEIATIKGRWKKIKEMRYWDPEAKKRSDNTKKNIKYGGIFTYNPNEELNIIDNDEKIKQCKIKMAGYLAEEVLLKSRSTKINNQQQPHKNNKLKALELIKSMHYDNCEEDFMPKKLKEELKEKIYTTFKQYEQEVKDLLIQNYNILEKIANELEEKELLTILDLQALLAKPISHK